MSIDGKNFSQYESVFLQLADEHGTVNAFELQELLDACLPNGKDIYEYTYVRTWAVNIRRTRRRISNKSETCLLEDYNFYE